MQNTIFAILKTNLASPSLRYLKGPAQGWQKPKSWPDIRKSASPSAIGINMLVCNAYPNFGFKATCAGGYSVYVNGIKQGDYASGAQCNLTLAALSGGTAITYPAAYTAHRVEIRPAAQGANITLFTIQRVAASGYESQGLLWAHITQTSPIDLYRGFYSYNTYICPLLNAVTTPSNEISVTGASGCFSGTDNAYLKYFPILNLASAVGAYAISAFTSGCAVSFTIKNKPALLSGFNNVFYNNNLLKLVRYINCSFTGVTTYAQCHFNNQSLVKLPKEYIYSSVTDMSDFITNAVSLQDTVLDLSSASALTKVGCYGSASYFMGGFKGLKVSSSAPFNGSAPQINVSYTGMTKSALLSLFASLPNVSGGQVCAITGATGAGQLSAADIQTATAKGWTITA